MAIRAGLLPEKNVDSSSFKRSRLATPPPYGPDGKVVMNKTLPDAPKTIDDDDGAHSSGEDFVKPENREKLLKGIENPE